MPASPSTRLPWVDHLRTLAILLVVNMHACVTYSHVGGWYILSEHEPTLPQKVPFILWQASLQSFFMGLLFFFAGYFASGSIARRGPADFLRERVIRLGLPALFYMLAIHPFILIALNPWRHDFGPFLTFYGNFLRNGGVLSASGPLWFALALLLFCVVLAMWRAVRPASAVPTAPSSGKIPRARTLWRFAVAVGLASFLVRLVQPLGTSLLNLQLAYFAQYIAAFIAGLAAAQHGWLAPLAASSAASRSGWAALFLGPAALLTLVVAGGPEPAVFSGGWHWQALGLALWEQLTGVGLSLGLLALFSRRVDRDTPWLRWLGDRSFAVYVLHAPVLVALMMAFRALPQNPYGLAALLTVTGLIVSFLVADLARRIPGLREVL